MMKAKLIKGMLFLLLEVQFMSFGFGQNNILENGFAGPILTPVLCEPGHAFKFIQLGSEKEEQGTDENVQYDWDIGEVSQFASADFVSGDGGYLDETQKTKPRPWIRLNSSAEHKYGVFEFSCFRTSKYGNQLEYVMVTMTDEPQIVSIKPKKGMNCWSDGEPITMDQFDVVTKPLGWEERVALNENSTVASAWSGGEFNQTLDFLFCDEPVDYHIDICVIDNSWQLDMFMLKLDRGLFTALEVIEETGALSEKIKAVTNKIEKCPLLERAKIKFSFNPYFNPGVSLKRSCCRNVSGSSSSLLYLTLNCHIGVEASLAGHIRLGTTPFYLDLGIKGALDITLIDYNLALNYYDGCNFYTVVPLALDIGLFGGVSFDPFDNPDLVSVSAKLIGGVTGQLLYYASNNGWGKFEPDGYMRVDVDAVCLMGRVHWSWGLLE